MEWKMYLVECPASGTLVHGRGEAAGTAFRIALYSGSCTVWAACWGQDKLMVRRGETASAIQGRIAKLDVKHGDPPEPPDPDGGQPMPVERAA